MPTTNEQGREGVAKDARQATNDARPQPTTTGALLIQWDDDEFAPTIVRGRE
jgi:hypothetical protein